MTGPRAIRRPWHPTARGDETVLRGSRRHDLLHQQSRLGHRPNARPGGFLWPHRITRRNASGFNSTVFIDTPITADSAGDIFFGFRVQGTAPAPLNTTQSGYARIDPNGNVHYILAGAAADGDPND